MLNLGWLGRQIGCENDLHMCVKHLESEALGYLVMMENGNQENTKDDDGYKFCIFLQQIDKFNA